MRWRQTPLGSASPTGCRTTPRSRSAPARWACWNWPAAYATFFNGGHRVTPFGLDFYAAAHPPVPVIDPERAAMMARMLAAVVTRGTGRAAAVPGYAVAGKTGTTQDSRDAWFIGCINGSDHRRLAGQ